MQRTALAFFVAVMAGLQETAIRAQVSAPPEFEVASVKENRSAERRVSRKFLPGGRVEIVNMPLRLLIGFAYGIDTRAEAFRLVGSEDAILSRRFDISAVAEARTDPRPEELVAMLRSLLAERFALRTHVEMRAMPVYALTVAHRDKRGPGLRPSEINCRALAGTPLESQPRDEDGKFVCGISGQIKVLPGGVRRRYAGTMAELAQNIQQQAPELHDRLVVDMTGLAGNFQWEITYADRSFPGTPDENLPSLFTAFKEQLGLKLEPTTASVEVRVIDALAAPTPN